MCCIYAGDKLMQNSHQTYIFSRLPGISLRSAKSKIKPFVQSKYDTLS